MRLKSKLLMSFASVVGLTLILGFSSWRAMDNMAIYSLLSTKFENALTDALVAQGMSLRYLLYEEDAYVSPVAEALERSIRYFEESRAFIRRPERLAEANNVIAKLQEYKKDFANVVQETSAMVQYDKALSNTSKNIDAQISKLLDFGKAQLRMNPNDAAFSFSSTITNTQKSFMQLRILAFEFARDPSSQNSAAIQEMLTSLINGLSTVHMGVIAANVKKDANTLIESLGNYATDIGKYQQCTAQRAAYVKQLRQTMDVISDHAQSLSLQVGVNIRDARDLANMQILGIALFVVVLCVGIAFFLNSNVHSQLGKDPGDLVVIARRVSAGDYAIDDGSARIGVYSDMLAMVAALKQHIDDARHESERAHEESLKANQAMQNAERASEEAATKTKRILNAATRLEEVVNIVSSASTQLAAQIEQSEHGAMEQASRVAETATAMNEMNSTVLEVARNAGTASDVSAATRKKAEAGADVVQQAVRSIQQVQAQSLTLKSSMSKLDDDARAISEIMGVISDIADQTNLLALNAAIEAARAGDAGRGFAVVADEVRKLAEKTMDSTTHVGNAIKSIQASASQSVGLVDGTVKTIEEATAFASQSGIALQEIVTMVDGTADQVRAIATASEEQSASSDEINHSISQVNAIASDTARAMGEAARAVSDLAEQAHALRNLIEDMKRV